MKTSNIIISGSLSLLIFYCLTLSPAITAPINILITTIFFIYGAIRNEPNITHISLLLLLFNVIEYITFETPMIDWSTGSFESNTIRGLLLYGIQLTISLFAFLAFIFRAGISRFISKSIKVAPIEQDAFIACSYLYLSFIYLLSLIDSIFYNMFNYNALNFIYKHYEFLVYIGWSLISASLITAAICHEKDIKIKKNISNNSC